MRKEYLQNYNYSQASFNSFQRTFQGATDFNKVHGYTKLVKDGDGEQKVTKVLKSAYAGGRNHYRTTYRTQSPHEIVEQVLAKYPITTTEAVPNPMKWQTLLGQTTQTALGTSAENFNGYTTLKQYEREYTVSTDRAKAWVSSTRKWTDDETNFRHTRTTTSTVSDSYKTWNGEKYEETTSEKFLISSVTETRSFFWTYETFMLVKGDNLRTRATLTPEDYKENNNQYKVIAKRGHYLRGTGQTADGEWRKLDVDRRFRTIVVLNESAKTYKIPRGTAQKTHTIQYYDTGAKAGANYTAYKPEAYKEPVNVLQGMCRELGYRTYDIKTNIDEAKERNKARALASYDMPKLDPPSGSPNAGLSKTTYVAMPRSEAIVNVATYTFGDLKLTETREDPTLVESINQNIENAHFSSELTRESCRFNSSRQTGTKYSQFGSWQYGKKQVNVTYWDYGTGAGLSDVGGKMVVTHPAASRATRQGYKDEPFTPNEAESYTANGLYIPTYTGISHLGYITGAEGVITDFGNVVYTSRGDPQNYVYRSGSNYTYNYTGFKNKDGDIKEELYSRRLRNEVASWTDWIKIPKIGFQTSVNNGDYDFGKGHEMWKFANDETLLPGYGVGAFPRGWLYSSNAMGYLYRTDNLAKFAYTKTKGMLYWDTETTVNTQEHSTNSDVTLSFYETLSNTKINTETGTIYGRRLTTMATASSWTYESRTNDDSNVPFKTYSSTQFHNEDVNEVTCAFIHVKEDSETCVKTNVYGISSRDSSTFSTSYWRTSAYKAFQSIAPIEFRQVITEATRHYTTWKLINSGTFLPSTVEFEDTDYRWSGGRWGYGDGLRDYFYIVGGYDSRGDNRINVLRAPKMGVTYQSAVCKEFTTKIDWMDFVLNPEKTFAQGTAVLVRGKPVYSKTETYNATTWYSHYQNFNIGEYSIEKPDQGIVWGWNTNHFKLPPDAEYVNGMKKDDNNIMWNGEWIDLDDYYEKIKYDKLD